MQKLLWRDHLPNSSVEQGVHLVSSLGWNLTWKRKGSLIYVHAGECCVLKTDSEAALEAFLYGMALAYSVLPDPVLGEFRKWIAENC